MFKKVKDWLGIEGVKIEIDIPDVVIGESGYVPGKIRFLSKSTQHVELVSVKLIERYSRGRGDEKKIDEYELGRMNFGKPFEVPGEQSVEMDFKLPFELVKSEMDQIAESNFLKKGLVSIARMIRAVKSKYFIIAEAKVSGVGLDPFVKKEIVIE